ncbi:uncharacterized protein LOC135824604 [Sycon ciliatum]|uniref:uncharacterized protein LOC135824604 n=1 Tax=Sycon ciliatum TaxID=27933 RepID=UPI0031F65044
MSEARGGFPVQPWSCRGQSPSSRDRTEHCCYRKRDHLSTITSCNRDRCRASFRQEARITIANTRGSSTGISCDSNVGRQRGTWRGSYRSETPPAYWHSPASAAPVSVSGCLSTGCLLVIMCTMLSCLEMSAARSVPPTAVTHSSSHDGILSTSPVAVQPSLSSRSGPQHGSALISANQQTSSEPSNDGQELSNNKNMSQAALLDISERGAVLHENPALHHDQQPDSHVVQATVKAITSFRHLLLPDEHADRNSTPEEERITSSERRVSPLTTDLISQLETPTVALTAHRTSLADDIVKLKDTSSAGRNVGLNSDDHIVPAQTVLPSLPRFNSSLSSSPRPANNRCKLVQRTVEFQFPPGCVEYYSGRRNYQLHMQTCSGFCNSEVALKAVPITADSDEPIVYQDLFKPKCKCCKERSLILKKEIWMKCRRRSEPRVMSAFEPESCGCKRCR